MQYLLVIVGGCWMNWMIWSVYTLLDHWKYVLMNFKPRWLQITVNETTFSCSQPHLATHVLANESNEKWLRINAQPNLFLHTIISFYIRSNDENGMFHSNIPKMWRGSIHVIWLVESYEWKLLGLDVLQNYEENSVSTRSERMKLIHKSSMNGHSKKGKTIISNIKSPKIPWT